MMSRANQKAQRRSRQEFSQLPRMDPSAFVEVRPALDGVELSAGVALESGETGAKSEGEGPDKPAPGAAANPGLESVQAMVAMETIAHPAPFFPKDPAPSLYWCDHAGVLIFATALAAVSKVSATTQAILAQWLAALWLGARNIEQTKFLNGEDLEFRPQKNRGKC